MRDWALTTITFEIVFPKEIYVSTFNLFCYVTIDFYTMYGKQRNTC